jgi:cobalt-precorrin-5B (C1)-methyltransferase
VQRLYDLPDRALIDMGDFVGGTLKYLRAHAVAWLTIAGGFAKLAKLAGGHLDLHSARSRVDTSALGAMLASPGADDKAVDMARAAAGAAEILALALAGSRERALARLVAARAREVSLAALSGETVVEVAIVDREGEFLARVGG